MSIKSGNESEFEDAADEFSQLPVPTSSASVNQVQFLYENLSGIPNFCYYFL